MVEVHPSVGVGCLLHLESVEIGQSEALVCVGDDRVRCALLVSCHGVRANLIEVILPELVDRVECVGDGAHD